MMETLAIIRQVFREDRMSRTQKVQAETKKKEKCNRRRPKSKACSSFFFDMKGIVRKEFVLAGQTANFTYYCDILRQLHENVRRPDPEL
jgi:hypothetical protein